MFRAIVIQGAEPKRNLNCKPTQFELQIDLNNIEIAENIHVHFVHARYAQNLGTAGKPLSSFNFAENAEVHFAHVSRAQNEDMKMVYAQNPGTAENSDVHFVHASYAQFMRTTSNVIICSAARIQSPLEPIQSINMKRFMNSAILCICVWAS